MNKLCIVVISFLLGMSALAQESNMPAAQQPTSPAGTTLTDRQQHPTYSDIYCAGFLRKELISHSAYVTGGLHTPEATHFAAGDTIFVAGDGLKEGAILSLVRELKDPNMSEIFPGQDAAIRATGQPYSDLGHARVIGLRNGIAVARIEFSCADAVAGDLVVPFEERPTPSVPETMSLDRFPPEGSGPAGRILMAKEFDTILGTGQAIYVDLGSNQGIKAGDYLTIVRSYNPANLDPVTKLSYKASMGEDTQASGIEVGEKDHAKLPQRAIGEAVVLMANPSSSTAMITLTLEDAQVGDRVEVRPANSAAAH